jgi:exopolysaccharide biosynthesis polyprenyl glycosylphosphotransferase
MLLLADVLGLVSALLLAEWLVDVHAAGTLAAGAEIVLFLVSVPAWLVVARLYGLYERDEESADHSTVDEFVGVFHMITVCTAALGVLAWLTGVAHPHPAKLVVFWAGAIALVSLGRALARTIARRRMTYLQNVVIVGAGEVGQLYAKKLLLHPEYGVNVVGFVDRHPKERLDELGHLTVLGSPDRLEAIIRLLDVERVIVAFSNESHEEMLEVLASIRNLNVQVDIVPRLFEIIGPGAALHAVEGLPVLGIRPLRIRPTSLCLKRVLDVTFALAVLILLAPLLVAIAVLVRFTSRGPIVYSDERIGRDGRFFRAYKFRTMYDHAQTESREQRGVGSAGTLEQILQDPVAREEFDRTRKLADDPRVTPLGRFLRRTSLDELPQFFNVWRGDVSLVGPRPITRFEFERYGQASTADWRPETGYWNFSLRPGLTGYWQINGRSSTEYADRVRLDTAYLTNWSLGLDLLILAKTVRVLASGRGAF